MKLTGKNIFITVLGFICLCFGTSCSSGNSDGDVVTGLSVDMWSGKTASWEFDGNEVQFELPQGVRTVELSAKDPVDIFMVKMNVGNTVIPASSTRYIVSSSTDGRLGGLYSSRAAEEENLFLGIDDWENVSGISPSGFIRKDYAPARDFVPPTLVSGSARTAAAENEQLEPITPITPEEGVTKKMLWVDVSDHDTSGVLALDGKKYTMRKATLRAMNDYCYVWVLDDNFSSEGTASGATINEDGAKNLAYQFEKMYEPIRDVFGEEADVLYHYYDAIDISELSDTGTKVNIVVYDIGGDYTEDQNGGMFGYFHPKDYYTPESASLHKDSTILCSNNGKYFYVDSGFLNSSPQMTYSTLAHEFQHMIHHWQKRLAFGNSSSTWFNEMMSMVCEDMIQQYLEIKASNSPISRFAFFGSNYYLSGLTDWLSGNDVVISYAGAYAFGAYLARNYGGKDLIKQIAINQDVDQEAITQALQENTDTSGEDFNSVFRRYPQALVLDNVPNAPSFYKEVPGIGDNNEVMTKIDLTVVGHDDFGNEYPFKPILLNPDEENRVDLRPYGFTLHDVVSINSAGTVNITFSSPVNGNEKIYLLVQPRKTN